MTRLILLLLLQLLIEFSSSQIREPEDVVNTKNINVNTQNKDAYKINKVEQSVYDLDRIHNEDNKKPELHTEFKSKDTNDVSNKDLTPSPKEHLQILKVNTTEQHNNTLVNKNKEKHFQNTLQPNFQQDVVQSGALLRGFYVLIGLSTLVLMYFLFRSYRVRRGAQAAEKIKKYGVVTRRNDIEMRRLELEEEDDENLFDIGQYRTNK